jgi:YbbR domain-containing protein
MFERVRQALYAAGFFGQEGVKSLRNNWGIAILALVLAGSLWVFVTDRENPDISGRVPGTIPIEVVNTPEDQAVVSLSAEAVTVQVRASESTFDDLDAADFRATVDLSAVEGESARVEVRVEAPESRIEVVEVSPAEVDVALEPVTSKAVPIEVEIVGTPPVGFDVGEIDVQPQEAVVTGPGSLVDLVVVAEAQADLTGASANFEQTILLEAQGGGGGKIEGVTLEPEAAVVRAELVQVVFSQVFVVVPDVTGTVADGFRVSAIAVEPQFVTVTGNREVFRSLDPTQGLSTEPVIVDGASADVVRPVALILPDDATASQPTVTVRITVVPLGTP